MPAPFLQKCLQNVIKMLINEPFCATMNTESQGGQRNVIYC